MFWGSKTPKFIQQRSQVRMIRFDEQLVSSAILDDLEPSLWHRFRSPRSQDLRENLLTKLGMT